MIGQTILHYKILEKLGEGGMGVVYKAEDTKLERTVAIKFLPRQIAVNSEERGRFKIEAKAAASLNHPNIATIYAIEEVDDNTFIVMEYIKGKELKELTSEKLQLSIKDVANYTTQIAEGLKAAHKKGVTHRDIKSSNIMITDEDQVKIMDFGLAKVRGGAQVTKVGTILGTAAYMSPEQARGEEADHPSDIWSFGVVLYEMLTGQLPFPGDYEQAVIYSILNERLEFPDGIPASFQQILQKALTKNLNDRYLHVEEMLADLKTVNATESMLVSSSKSAKTGLNAAVWKRRFFFGGAIGLLALAAILLIFFLVPDKSGQADRKSIAVLPFENLSADEENEYFSDGITEDIISQISKIGDLKVISRTSIMYYKKREKKLREIGKELGVATILQGSVRRANGRVRIVAQLIDVKTDNHLWAETYDRDLTDVFAIQSDVAQQIANALQAKLSPAEKERIEKKATESLQAYNLYLLGRFYWNKRTKEGLEKAIEFFEQAINEDSSYALAYAGLADCYSLLPFYGGWRPKEAYPKARISALKALALDSTLAEAHTSLGAVKNWYDWNWLEAEIDFKRAIKLKPGYATGHHWYGAFMGLKGRLNEGIAEVRQALELDPLSLIINRNLGDLLYFAGRYDEAIKQFQNVLAIDSTNSGAHRGLGRAYVKKGISLKAITEFQKAVSLSQSDPEILAELGYAYSVFDEQDEALAALTKVIEVSKEKLTDPIYIAKLYGGLDKKDQAFEALEEAYQQRSPNLVDEIYLDPFFDSLRPDPRFSQLLKKMGLEK